MCGAEVSSSAEVVVCSEACEEQLVVGPLQGAALRVGGVGTAQ